MTVLAIIAGLSAMLCLQLGTQLYIGMGHHQARLVAGFQSTG